MTLNEREKELELFNAFVKKELPELFEKYNSGNFFAKVTYDSMFVAWLGAKAQAVPASHTHSVTLTCAELKEAYDFGAPDESHEQLTDLVTIGWHENGHSGAGYYAYMTECEDEGSIKLGESESGAEG